mgnify:CR=1 FL=1
MVFCIFLLLRWMNLDSNIQNTNLFEIGRIFKVRNGKITEQEKLVWMYSSFLNN